MIDPLGGAPFVEALTDELEARALALMAEVERRGGAVKAIESGFVQREIHRSALAWQRAVERGERVVVGVNQFQNEEPPAAIQKPSAAARAEVLADLAEVRKTRDPAKVEGALRAVGEAARASRTNLMEPILVAVSSLRDAGRDLQHARDGLRALPAAGGALMEVPQALRGVTRGLHHVAIAVPSLAEARAVYETALGMRAHADRIRRRPRRSTCWCSSPARSASSWSSPPRPIRRSRTSSPSAVPASTTSPGASTIARRRSPR